MRFVDLRFPKLLKTMSINEMTAALDERDQWLSAQLDKTSQRPLFTDFLSPYRANVLKELLAYCRGSFISQYSTPSFDEKLIDTINSIFGYALEDAHDWKKDIIFFNNVISLFSAKIDDLLKERLSPVIAKSRVSHAAYMEFYDPRQQAVLEGYLMTLILTGMLLYYVSENPFYIVLPFLGVLTKVLSFQESRLVLAGEAPSIASELVKPEPFHSFFLFARSVAAPAKVIEGLRAAAGYAPELFPSQHVRNSHFHLQEMALLSQQIGKLKHELEQKQNELTNLVKNYNEIQTNLTGTSKKLTQANTTIRENATAAEKALAEQTKIHKQAVQELQDEIDRLSNELRKSQSDLEASILRQGSHSESEQETSSVSSAANDDSSDVSKKKKVKSPEDLFVEQQKRIRSAEQFKFAVTHLETYIAQVTAERNNTKLAVAEALLKAIKEDYSKTVTTIVAEAKRSFPDAYKAGIISHRLHNIAKELEDAEKQGLDLMQAHNFKRN